jgi:hypothetical protein
MKVSFRDHNPLFEAEDAGEICSNEWGNSHPPAVDFDVLVGE